MNVEAIIRDSLASNINILEPSLTLLQKEYPLPNAFGSRGYIDLLAKDSFGNFVIIEVKRSQASSRQTIQEILKYVGLLKQNFRARDSEIRVIIASTHWDELLVPFTELTFESTLAVKGIQLNVDAHNNVVSIFQVQPLSARAKRRFAKSYIIDLFFTAEKRAAANEQMRSRCEAIGLKDYVLLNLSAHNPEKHKNVVFPFACCFAFQEADETTYRMYFKNGGTEDKLDMHRDEFDDEDDYFHYLEQVLLITADGIKWRDSAESGSPEKLDGIILAQGWSVDEMLRHGIFREDPRLTDEMLMAELRGLDGNSQIKYYSFAESTHKNRLAEIAKNCLIPLQNNPEWTKTIRKVFQKLATIVEPFRIVVNVYQPQSAFDSICRLAAHWTLSYLPIFLIHVDFVETDKFWLYGGKLVWDKEAVDINALIEYLLDDAGAFITKFHDSVLGMHDDEILSHLHLHYKSTFQSLEGRVLATERPVDSENGTADKYVGLGNWINANHELLDVLKERFLDNIVTKDSDLSL